MLCPAHPKAVRGDPMASIRTLNGKNLSGELARPIRPATRIPLECREGSSEYEDIFRTYYDEVSGKRLQKLLLLAQHYGADAKSLQDIHPLVYFTLFYRLACDCVPGFDIKGKGRPKTRDKSARLLMMKFLINCGLAKDDTQARKLLAEMELKIKEEDQIKKGKRKHLVNDARSHAFH
jgi:hypothetical protein